MAKMAFAENSIAITDSELDETVLIFLNLIQLNTGQYSLNGMSAQMMPALQDALIERIGKINSLQTLSTQFDAYAKKLLIVTRIDTFNNVSSLTMMPLFKKLNIIVPVPLIDLTNIETYKGVSSGTYIFGTAYFTRNQVHNSPEWDFVEIVRRLRYVIALYILVTFKKKQQLLSHNPDLNKIKTQVYGDNKESQTAYDIISYGRPSNMIRNQIVNSYILHQIYGENQLQVSEVVARVTKFSDGTIKENAIKRIINNLFSNKSLEYADNSKTVLKLTDSEETRLRELQEAYNDSLNLLHTEIDTIIAKYSLNVNAGELINVFGFFLENNFNLDVLEGCDVETDMTASSNYIDLLEKIKNFGCDDDCAELVFKEILETCKRNDVLVRISAGRVFSRISNPDQFDNYIRSKGRSVYMDTQILLYILCVNDEYPDSDSIFYKIAKNILELKSTNKSIHFKVSSHYLSELIHQLKQAIYLIQFTEIKHLPDIPISTNVFYQYYYHLSKNNKLPEGVDTYRDFIEDMFSIGEEEAFSSDYEQIADGVVRSILEDDFDIEVEQTPRFESDKLQLAQKLFEKVIKDNYYDPKPPKALLNDSLEILVLFEKEHEGPDPVFLTWDKAFAPMRKAYKERYKRGYASLFFHLFSPSRFLNHVDLIDFKINSNTLTDDLLSIIETGNFKQPTFSVIDTINKFLDIPNIGVDQRKNYIKKIQRAVYNDNIFPYGQTESDQSNVENKKTFTYVSQSLFNYYKDKGDGSTKNYRNMLLNENAFDKFMNIIVEYLKSDNTINDTTNVAKSVDVLIENFLENTKLPK